MQFLLIEQLTHLGSRGRSGMVGVGQHPFQDGPYVRIATICERVLQEQDGVLSLIRVIDRVTHTVLELDSAAGHGTRVRLRLPVPVRG